jgi:DNA polymerase-3 subunit delta
MRLKAEQLQSHLEKTTAPIYIISGDEPLLIQECCDAIRKHCSNNGFNEKEILDVDTNFDWQQLLASANALSLFSEKKLIELRLPSGKPGSDGSKALVQYASNAPEDNVLLIICNKLEGSSYKSKWYKTLESAGVGIQLWPIGSKELPRWITQRLNSAGLKATPEALQLLSERVEGNLLAAAQEIEKLKLATDSNTIDTDMVSASVSDNARYDLFSFVDKTIQGDVKSSLKMLRGLKSEGTEATVVLWALAREIRTLYQCAQQMEQGNGLERVLQNQRVWDRRKPLVKSVLQRLKSKQLGQLLQLSTKVDHSIKGIGEGDSWTLLEQLVLRLSGSSFVLNQA